MAVESRGLRESFNAGEDLTECIFHAVKFDSNGDLVKGTAGARCAGILQDDPDHDEVGSVMYLGVSPAVLGSGGATAGDDLASDANGHLVPAVAGDCVVAIATETGSENEEITVLILPQTPGAYPVGEQGDVLFFNGSNWVVLHHGTAKQSLESGGHGANPAWASKKEWWIFGINLADIADGDLITDWIPGFAGTITDLIAIVNKAATTESKASTLNLEIETTNVTGSDLALTSANMTPKGVQVACAGITAANVFTAAQKISVEAASTTPFSEGSIWLMIGYTRP